jgi:hypothetical protein
MPRIGTSNQDERLVRGEPILFRTPCDPYLPPPEVERCELILWIEAGWRCEYWRLGESGKMRLLKGPDTIIDLPVTDPIAALHEVKVWHEVVRRGGEPNHG